LIGFSLLEQVKDNDQNGVRDCDEGLIIATL